MFIVGEAMAELNQAPEGGARFPVDARLDGRTFVKFHVDLGVGDEVLEPLDTVEGEDWLGFAAIPAVVIPALSVEQHWAGRTHALSASTRHAEQSRAGPGGSRADTAAPAARHRPPECGSRRNVSADVERIRRRMSCRRRRRTG